MHENKYDLFKWVLTLRPKALRGIRSKKGYVFERRSVRKVLKPQIWGLGHATPIWVIDKLDRDPRRVNHEPCRICFQLLHPEPRWSSSRQIICKVFVEPRSLMFQGTLPSRLPVLFFFGSIARSRNSRLDHRGISLACVR